jgi:phytoene synthase
MLPRAKRNAIVAVWDFCRAVDDAVDEAVPLGEWPLTSEARAKAERELALWRAELDRCFDASSGLALTLRQAQGHPERSRGVSEVEGLPTTPQGRALAPVVAAFNLPREPFHDLVDGVAMDLEHDRYETFDELLEYCRRVASAVGLICIEIFGVRDKSAREYAINLGIALQLTNIIRDVGVDLARGRVYLPQEDLARFGCTDAHLRRGVVTPDLRALLAFQCVRARHYFTRAAQALRHTNARRVVAAEIMGAVYLEILRRVDRSHYDVFSRVIRVPRPARAVIALATWAKTIAVSVQRDGVRLLKAESERS